MKQKSARFGSIIFFRYFSRFADFDHLHETGGLKRKDVMSDPGRGLPKRPRQMREGSGGCHQQAQDFHPARIGQQFDLAKSVQGFDAIHTIKFFLNCKQL